MYSAKSSVDNIIANKINIQVNHIREKIWDVSEYITVPESFLIASDSLSSIVAIKNYGTTS